jgi:hypothetical protein
MSTKLVWAAAAALVALSACGGGGGDRDDEPTAVPDSVLASPEEFTRWVGDREESVSREPLAMNDGMPPTSETAEPVEID